MRRSNIHHVPERQNFPRRLSADEQRDIKSLYVKVGKIGGYVRSRGRSGVWTYFGELCFKQWRSVAWAK